MSVNEFYYSTKYEDDEYEYRHVHVPKEVARLVPKNRLMSETEWRSLGVQVNICYYYVVLSKTKCQCYFKKTLMFNSFQQSAGWIHYMIHSPERHILLFRRPKPKETHSTASITQKPGMKNQLGVRWSFVLFKVYVYTLCSCTYLSRIVSFKSTICILTIKWLI